LILLLFLQTGNMELLVHWKRFNKGQKSRIKELLPPFDPLLTRFIPDFLSSKFKILFLFS